MIASAPVRMHQPRRPPKTTSGPMRNGRLPSGIGHPSPARRHGELAQQTHTHAPEPVNPNPALHSLFPHDPVLHSRLLHRPVPHSPALHDPFLHSPVLHSPALHDPYLHSRLLKVRFFQRAVQPGSFLQGPALHIPALHDPGQGASRPQDLLPKGAAPYIGGPPDGVLRRDVLHGDISPRERLHRDGPAPPVHQARMQADTVSARHALARRASPGTLRAGPSPRRLTPLLIHHPDHPGVGPCPLLRLCGLTRRLLACRLAHHRIVANGRPERSHLRAHPVSDLRPPRPSGAAMATPDPFNCASPFQTLMPAPRRSALRWSRLMPERHAGFRRTRFQPLDRKG